MRARFSPGIFIGYRRNVAGLVRGMAFRREKTYILCIKEWHAGSDSADTVLHRFPDELPAGTSIAGYSAQAVACSVRERHLKPPAVERIPIEIVCQIVCRGLPSVCTVSQKPAFFCQASRYLRPSLLHCLIWRLFKVGEESYTKSDRALFADRMPQFDSQMMQFGQKCKLDYRLRRGIMSLRNRTSRIQS